MQQAVAVVALILGGVADQVAVAGRRGDVVPGGGGGLPSLSTIFGDVVPAVATVADAHQDATVNKFSDFGLVAAYGSAT